MANFGIQTPKPPQKCGIFIGVNNVIGLNPLSAAVDNAEKMNEWATAQGFETRLFVDTGGKAIIQRDIYNAVKELLDLNPEQFIVYFAGHGYLRNAGTEIWLLTEAIDNANEAIDLPACKISCQDWGIKNVIFISDACRSVASSYAELKIAGGTIFPNGRNDSSITRVDVLFASRAGHPSHEYRDENGAYHGIYTESLLTCLHGGVVEIIKELASFTDPISAVVSYDLNEFLERRLPEISSERRLPFIQRPHGEVTSREPIYISKIEKAKRMMPDGAMIAELVTNIEDVKTDVPIQELTLEERIQNLTDEYGEDLLIFNEIKESEKITFDIAKDLPVSSKSASMSVTPELEVRGLNGYHIYYSVGIWLIQPDTNGHGIPVPRLDGFNCIAGFQNGALLTIDYKPLGGLKLSEYEANSNEIAKRKATIITAAKYGLFEGSDGLATYLRRVKSLDPTLGLFAAYAYMQNGNKEGVRSVYEFMAREPEPVLFDVEMLNFLANDRKGGRDRPIASFMPLLTQGWSYVGLSGQQHLTKFIPNLVPGLWTTFTEEGVRRLDESFKIKK